MVKITIVKEGITASGSCRLRGSTWHYGLDLLGADDDGDGFRIHLTQAEFHKLSKAVDAYIATVLPNA